MISPHLVGLVAIILSLGGPVWLLTRWLKYRHEERLKQLQPGPHEETKILQAAKTELEERVRNLESIVCSVDFELNAKLNQLASRQYALAAPPRHGSATSPEAPDANRSDGTTLNAGKRLGNRFVIERAIGHGGMGSVYLAHDEQLGEQVALKLIAGHAAFSPQANERLRREASSARRITHPNVVRLHDLGDADGLLFLSMEYVAGGSLRDLLARHGVLPSQQLRGFASQMCEGLQAAHMAGVIHRDLKPANLLINEHQQVKIIDFGLARLAHLEGMTATNMIAGTVEYMAPEQIRGGPIDARTDVYATGALLFHALVGRPPFLGDNPIAVGFAHCTEPIPVPSIVRPDLASTWDEVITRALAKDPAHRWSSMLELRDALPT